jgi:hypothetical protein
MPKTNEKRPAPITDKDANATIEPAIKMPKTNEKRPAPITVKNANPTIEPKRKEYVRNGEPLYIMTDAGERADKFHYPSAEKGWISTKKASLKFGYIKPGVVWFEMKEHQALAFIKRASSTTTATTTQTTNSLLLSYVAGVGGANGFHVITDTRDKREVAKIPARGDKNDLTGLLPYIYSIGFGMFCTY